MALTTPNPKQVRFAKQVAWERGQTITRWPETSSALSGLIQTLLSDYEPLPVHERQVQELRDLLAKCVARIPGFEVNDELPSNRAEANRRIFGLRRRLAAVEFYAAKDDATSFLAPAGTAEPAPAPTVEGEALSESDVAQIGDDIAF